MARILVVDDEPDLRTFIERALSVAGHEVTATFDGYAALSALRDQSYDCLLYTSDAADE